MLKIFKVITGFGSNRRSIASKFYIFFHQNLKKSYFVYFLCAISRFKYFYGPEICSLWFMKWHLHSGMNKKWFTCKFQFFFIKNLKKFRYFLKNFQFLSFIFSIWTWVCVLTAREYSLHIRLVIQCLSWAFLCMNFTAEEL